MLACRLPLLFSMLNSQPLNHQSIDDWHRYAKTPGWIRDRFINTEFYNSPRKNFEIGNSRVTEALLTGEKTGPEYFLSLLLSSGATSPMEADFHCGRFQRPNNPGDMVFCGPIYPEMLQGTGPFHSIVLYFSRQTLEENCRAAFDKDLPDLSYLHSRSLRDDTLEILLKQLFFEFRHGASGVLKLKTDCLFNGITSRLITLANRDTVPAFKADSGNTFGIQRAIDYMHANLADSLGLDELAQAAGLNRSHFARAFKLATGQTAINYLMKLRIGKAQSLLRSPHPRDLTIAKIASDCGFAQLPHFTTKFRQIVGTTPAAYRNG